MLKAARRPRGTATRPLCVVLGGGGHARMVIEALRAEGRARVWGILDEDRAQWGAVLDGVPIRGGDDLLQEAVRRGVRRFVIGLGSVGDSEPRRRLYALASGRGLAALTVCHPSAIVSPSATLAPGAVLLPAAVVNSGAVIGHNVIVNTGAIVEHDCRVGDHAHIATGARLAGAVTVGAGAHVGAGAVVRQGIVIGERAVIGAGAAVVRDVPADALVIGVPARRRERPGRTS